MSFFYEAVTQLRGHAAEPEEPGLVDQPRSSWSSSRLAATSPAAVPAAWG